MTRGFLIRTVVGMFLTYGWLVPFRTEWSAPCNDEISADANSCSGKSDRYELIECGTHDWRCCRCSGSSNDLDAVSTTCAGASGACQEDPPPFPGSGSSEWGSVGLWMTVAGCIGSLMGFFALYMLFRTWDPWTLGSESDQTLEAVLNFAFEFYYGLAVIPMMWIGYIVLATKYGPDYAIAPIITYTLSLIYFGVRIYIARKIGLGPEKVIIDVFFDFRALWNLSTEHFSEMQKEGYGGASGSDFE